MSDAVHVRHLADRRRFAADVGAGEDAVLAYEILPGGTLDLQHTVVPPEARGGGVASALVAAAVAHARAEGLTLVPTCPYVAAWLGRHPGDADVFAQPGAEPGAEPAA
jgi:predicted GNAT family acetyltransferase